MPRVPKIDARLVDFCKELSPIEEPRLVPIQAPFGSTPDRCHFNVESEMKSHEGSTQRLGWLIWEVPYGFFEAIFHSVLVLKDGTEIDVTPQTDVGNIKQVVFLPDSAITYDRKKAVPARYKSLDHDKDVSEFIRLRAEYDAIWCEIDSDVGPTKEQRATLENLKLRTDHHLKTFIQRSNSPIAIKIRADKAAKLAKKRRR